MKYFFTLSFILITSLWLSCGGKQDADEKQHSENEHSATEEGQGHEESTVELTSEQAAFIGLEMQALTERNMGNSIKVSGTIALFPQDKANVSPLIGGNVRSIRVVPGDNVSRGQILAYIEHPDIIAVQQQYQESNNELVFLKKDFERKQTLFSKGVTSGKDFQLSESKYKAAQATIRGLGAQLGLLGINASKVAAGQIFSSVPITSPISGYVDAVLISIGDYVPPSSKMFSISDNSKIYVSFKVYEQDIKTIKKGQQIYFSTATAPDKLLSATVRSVGKSFDTEPKALEVLADIKNNNKNLLPGMYVEGRIVHGEKKGFAVPEAAVIKDGDHSFIFILDEDEAAQKGKMKFKQVPVTVGISDLGYIEVSLPAEVPKEAKVVIKGAYNLSSEMMKGELEHSH